MIDLRIKQLVNYGIKNSLISECDSIYVTNQLLRLLRLEDYDESINFIDDSLENILNDINKYAYEKGIIDGDTPAYTDLFDTLIMDVITPMPHEVIKTFNDYYNDCPKKATDWYYSFSQKTNYIRTDRIKKDLKWKYSGKYGELDITINLSKPEKDPRAIAQAKKMQQVGYPKCALCKENEGYAGSVNKAARENHRIIPIELKGEKWFLQYSPYVYYNEHCICLSSVHRPMQINKALIEKLLDFVTIFPHYFIGSNADLPIVGGSILSHDHMQGGKYTFAMEKAKIKKELVFKGFENVKAGIVDWPLSVIRISDDNPEILVELADKILKCWRGYTDEESFVFSETNNEPHNTITPIARRKGSKYELDLVLRNNITTEEFPLGYYHPHPEKFNIKKENIGLIEVMGLAVLPSRLKKEMELVKDAVINDVDFYSDEKIRHHYNWYMTFKNKYTVTKDNIDEIFEKEIGKTFEEVLEDAGVFKNTAKGEIGFQKFINKVNE